MSAQIYQVGAHFEAPIEGILMAPLKTIERVFFAFRVPLPDCVFSVEFFLKVLTVLLIAVYIGIESQDI